MDVEDASSSLEAFSETTEPPPRVTVEDPQPARGSRREVVLCLLLHFGLVAVHGVLFIVYAHHWEHRVTTNISASSTTWFPLLVTIILQTVGTVRYISHLAFYPADGLLPPKSCTSPYSSSSRNAWLCAATSSRARL